MKVYFKMITNMDKTYEGNESEMLRVIIINSYLNISLIKE